jgi:hypothetical protein
VSRQDIREESWRDNVKGACWKIKIDTKIGWEDLKSI